MIISGKYLSDTFWVSRHYASVPLIVYHYSRILSRFKIKALDSARQELAERLPQLYEAETEATGLLLLEIAARRLQVPLPEIKTGVRGEFYSFIGAPFAPLKSPVFQAAAPSPRAWIGWKCPAHELALRLENELLKNR